MSLQPQAIPPIPEETIRVVWSIQEVFWYKVAPALFVPYPSMKPKRLRGRPRKRVTVEPTQPKQSRERPLKYVLAEFVAAARAAGSFST